MPRTSKADFLSAHPSSSLGKLLAASDLARGDVLGCAGIYALRLASTPY